jgi:hypothetical protein
MTNKPDVLAMLAGDLSDVERKRERNRALMQKHMPEMFNLIEDLRARGMGGRLVKFEIKESAT